MKDKRTKIIPVGTMQTRYLVTLIDDPVTQGDIEKRLRQREFIRTLYENAELMNCGPALFQKMRMFFSGSEWVIELEALVDEPAGARLGNTKSNPA